MRRIEMGKYEVDVQDSTEGSRVIMLADTSTNGQKCYIKEDGKK